MVQTPDQRGLSSCINTVYGEQHHQLSGATAQLHS